MAQKKCLVIGGGSDIGREVVAAAYGAGYEVLWTYHQSDIVNVGRKFHCDLTSERQVEALTDLLGETPLDLVVTAAFPFIVSDSFDFAAYLKTESILRSHLQALTHIGARMRGGKIFNILGQCVERGLDGGAFYSASFAYLHNWANSVNANEGKAGKVAVCDLLMGPVDTREWSGLPESVLALQVTRAEVHHAAAGRPDHPVPGLAAGAAHDLQARRLLRSLRNVGRQAQGFRIDASASQRARFLLAGPYPPQLTK